METGEAVVNEQQVMVNKQLRLTNHLTRKDK